MPMYQDIFDWIKGQQSTLDGIIKTASARYYKEHNKEPNFTYDIQQCYQESLNLSRGEDLCYDRPNVALPYALWYLGRRVNTMISVLFPLVMKASTDRKNEIHLFDIGAGTGATQIAISVIHHGLKSHNLHTPNLIIENIDTSPFMLNFCKTYLWAEMINAYGEADITCHYSVNSWISQDKSQIIDPWFTASYLFDSSDNTATLIEEFYKLIERFQPSVVCLTSSNQQAKRNILNDLKQKVILDGNYTEHPLSDMPFSGGMPETNIARSYIKNQHNAGFNNSPSWTERSFYSISLRKTQDALFSSSLLTESTTDINLFNPPIVVRRDIKLNEQQESAARLNQRPTIITGPAGCGKSVVLSERIKNVVEKEGIPYDPKLRILVTTFNKDLMAYLSDWVIDLLDEKNITVANKSIIKFNGSEEANIKFMHFDILPTRIGGVRGDLAFENFHLEVLEKIIKEYKQRHSLGSAHDDILNASYLFDEYHRIFYGQNCHDKKQYLTATRIRRRPILHSNSPRRNYIADIIITYLKELKRTQKESLYTRRRKLLNQLYDGNSLAIFSHVFVDEFQDCTPADYSIFYGLLSNNNNLVLTGDFAQSIQLGSQANVPREDEEFTNQGVTMRYRQTHTLTGSFRLPARVSESIVRLSEYIQTHLHEDADLISPYKGSPPGARPIIIYGNSEHQLAQKIVSVIQRYNVYDIVNLNSTPPKKITILEKDYGLASSLNSLQNGIAETDTILKLKGMEKLCITLSTTADIENTDEKYNFIYTIMTRTAALLIITLTPKSKLLYKEPLSLLRKDRLIYWDLESEREYQSFTT